MEIYGNKSLSSPHWELRNRFISETILIPERSLIDMGCGNKNILKYYIPSKYLGVDIVDFADLKIDLDKNFQLESGWDYCLCSGLFHCLKDPISFLGKIKGLSNQYIFTWWNGRGYGRVGLETFESMIIFSGYEIEETHYWGPCQKIWLCKTVD